MIVMTYARHVIGVVESIDYAQTKAKDILEKTNHSRNLGHCEFVTTHHYVAAEYENGSRDKISFEEWDLNETDSRL